jgi:hypothetical protein
MTNHIIFPIGDWSCDGHNCYAEFLVSSEKSLEDVREAHFKENAFIGSLCQEYEDNKIDIRNLYDFFLEYVTEDEAKSIITGFISDDVELTDEEEEFNSISYRFKSWETQKLKLDFEFKDEDNPQLLVIHYPQDMLKIWITILNVINPELKLEIASEAMSHYYIKYKGYPHEPVGDINFYGYDKQNRHLNTPGYGIWKDYEGEFYHAC